MTWAQWELGKLVTLISKLIFTEASEGKRSEMREGGDPNERGALRGRSGMGERSEAIRLLRAQIGQLAAMGLDLLPALDELIGQHLERLVSEQATLLERDLILSAP